MSVQLPPRKIGLGLGFGLGLALELGLEAIFLGGNCPRTVQNEVVVCNEVAINE